MTRVCDPKLNIVVLFLRSWYRASLMYSSITNKMQRYTIVFIIINALHVSGGFSAHHQELTHSIGYLSSFFCFLPLSWVRYNAEKARQIPDAMYELLMLGGGIARNM
jgi:hypothetical protein